MVLIKFFIRDFQVELTQSGLTSEYANVLHLTLVQNPRLQILKLGYNALGDDGIRTISPGIVSHPSLKVLDDLNYHSLIFGFPLLTLGIMTGAVWAEYAWGRYWAWDPKETWSLVTWFLYAALLHQRLTVGWRGRRAAIMAIVGFLAVMFTFLGVSYLLPGLHSYLN